MDIFWLFAKYILLVLVVVFSANKLGEYVDEIDKNTKLGAAFIGGVFLAMVTSLPEFITSISATLVYGEPGLAFGNVLGSNMFNLVILATADLLFVRYFLMNKIKASKRTNLFVIGIYLIITIPMVFVNFTNFEVSVITIRLFKYTISGISVAIVILYILSVKHLSSSEKEISSDEETPKPELDNKGKIKKIILLFIFWSIVLVASAIYITGITNDIYKVLGISSSFAGAIFLGIATSVPELTAVLALVRLKNFSAAASNIVGSNLFNFLVLSVVDILYFKQNIFDQILTEGSTQQNVIALLILGLINSIILLFVMVRKPPKRKVFYVLPSILIIFMYLVYLMVSF